MHWRILPVQQETVHELEQELGLHKLVTTTLAARGIKSAAEAIDFTHPQLDKSWEDPKAIKGLVEVCDHLESAIRNQKKIVVFGDYDVDGVSASTVIIKALSALDTVVQVVLPKRNGEGYGLSEPALARIFELNPDVLITVDCGISAAKEAIILQNRGIEVLITDHHEGGDDIPVNIPIADPKLEPNGPSFNLAGVGVALKLIDLLGKRFNKPDLWRSFTDLAALGTIADQMPLLAENRALVYDGIKQINCSKRPGIIAVLKQNDRDKDKDVSASSLTFGLIPRLNAAGRISDPMIALDLLATDDPDQANKIAQDLESLNIERRALEAELVEQAIKQADSLDPNNKVTVVWGDGWHDGVKGIVASRLVRHYGVPSIVFSVEGDEAVGSGRSVGSVNLYKCVSELSDMLIRYGGHEGAIGVSLKTNRLEEFILALAAVMEREPEDSFYPALQIDALVQISDLGIAQIEELALLEPYGNSNPTPVYLLKKVLLKCVRAVGSDSNHLSFKVTDGQDELSAIWFNCPEVQTYLNCKQPVDIAFNVKVEIWRERKQVKLHVVDIRLTNKIYDQIPAILPIADNATANASASKYYQAGYVQKLNIDQPNAINDELAKALLGSVSASLHYAQIQALESLDQGNNTLVIMATGRGKSLIFQINAAKLALKQKQQSIFIYPLRALINDQEFALSNSFAQFDLSCTALTGATSSLERDSIYKEFAAGSIDVLLTTPEFLLFHRNELLNNQNIGFVVVDEAHHIATSSNSFRPLYTKLNTVHQALPKATILALTATANKSTADEIVQALDINEQIIDQTQRDNLLLDDQRNIADREQYLINIIARSSKAIIYVNSRSLSIDLTRLLRKNLPVIATSIGFYNAGLSKTDRVKVEQAFRSGVLNYIVATSAFGEGVNIPDIRDVVLFDLPFSIIDFNQMSGRAGRDGKDSVIHLLCNQEDGIHNGRILATSAPGREQLVILWRAMINVVAQIKAQKLILHNLEELLGNLEIFAKRIDVNFSLDAQSLRIGVSIFHELKLIDLDDEYKISINQQSEGTKVDLLSSTIYLEGLEAIQSFDNFKNWLFASSSDELLSKLQKPLVPIS
jgi:single-stranded-DNA-specific exonuclease